MLSRRISYTALLAAAIILLTGALKAQEVPQAMNYQAAARDSIGMPLANRAISVRLSILKGSATGQPVYVERHGTVTDDLGLFVVAIGRGTPELGTFLTVDWSRRDYWLKVEMDVNGKDSYTDLGAQQLLSVPYALFAQRAARADTALVAYRTIDGGSTSGDSSAWRLRGNRGTDPTKDFLGTSDSAALSLRTNGAERLRIDADGTVSITNLTGGGHRIVVADDENGGELGSRTLIELMDDGFWETLRETLGNDSAFIDRLTTRIDSSIRRDSTFIGNLTNDSIFNIRLRLAIDSLSRRDSIMIAGLAHDSTFLKTIVRNLDTLHRRDTLVIRDSISVASLVKQIDTLLLRDSLFMTSLINDSLLAARIRTVGAATFWSLTGSSGTDPSRNFLGTTDAKALALRTENTERLRITAGNGYVGVGTASPAERLHVAGSIRSDSLAGTGTRILVTDPAGTIRSTNGIGALIAPSIDTILSHDSVFITNLTTDPGFTGRIKTFGDSTYWSQTGTRGTNPARNYIGTSDNAPLSVRTDGAERIRVNSGNGFVGVGTAAPSERLEVAGNIKVDSMAGGGTRLVVADANGVMRSPANVGAVILPQIDTLLATDQTFLTGLLTGTPFTNSVKAIADATSWSLTGTAGTDPSRNFLGTTDNASLALRTNNAERVRINAGNGYVGVGTTLPAERLHVAGNIRSDSLAGAGIRILTSDPVGTVRASSNVGPLLLPQIDTLLSGDATFINRLTGGSTFINRIATIGDTLFWSLHGSSNIDPTKSFLGTVDNTPITVRTNNAERLRVAAGTGFVGIGTSTPAERLHVAGNIRSDGLAGTGVRLAVTDAAGTLGATTNVGPIILPQIDSALGHDATFINNLTADPGFTGRIKTFGDSTYWSLTGTSGSNPTRNFLGTTDNVALAFRTGNTERVRINAGTGFVGVGTATPGERLHVAGNIRSDSMAGAGTRLIVTDPAGTMHATTNVGPLLLPQIDTLLSNDATFVTSLTGGSTFINRIATIGDTLFWSLHGSSNIDPTRTFLGTTDNTPITVRTNNAERLRVAAGTGFVGIGTGTPSERLHVAGNIRVDSLAGVGTRLVVTDPAGIVHAATNIGPVILPQIDTLLSNDATFINRLTGGSTFINRIATIGDTLFWSLHGSSNIDPTKTFLGTIDNTPITVRTNNTERLRVAAGTGFVGIGTATPSERLHVVGNIRVDSLAGVGTRLVVTDPAGTVHATTNIGPVILPQIDTLLANDATFVTSLTGSNTFINRIATIGDTLFWSLHGSSNIDPTRTFLGTTDNTPITVRTNNTERLRVAAGTGFVGIGTATPSERLHVAGNIRVDSLAGVGTRLVVTDPAGTVHATTNIGPVILPQIDTLLANDATFVTSLTGGSTFINRLTTIGDTLFWSLHGSSNIDPTKTFLGTTDNTPITVRTNNTERLRVAAGTGFVGIGTATPGERLHVAGNIRVDSLAGAGIRILTSDPNGTMRASANIGPIILPQIDSLLGRDSTFITSLGGDNRFITRVRTIIDTSYWSRNGSAGTDPTRNFLGTTDNVALALRTNNTERVRIDAAGLVGIGTTTPTEQLDVAGNIRSSGLAGTGNRLIMADATGALRTATNIGPSILPLIDTLLARDSVFVTTLVSSPTFTADVRAIGDTSYWSLRGSAGTNPTRNFLGTTDNVALALRTNNTERVRIDATGSVGIGTTTPAGKLDISNGNLVISNTSNLAGELRLQEPSDSGTNYIAFRARPLSSNLVFDLPNQQGAPNTVLTNNGSGVLSWTDVGSLVPTPTNVWSTSGNLGLVNAVFGSLDNNPLRFVTGAGGPNERLRIDVNGFVGIGTTTPAHHLDVVDSSTTDEVAAIHGATVKGSVNQEIGVWGAATDASVTSPGTIGVLATGNGATAANRTNIALEVTGGGIAVGRTTEAGAGYTVVENANGGAAYSAQGASGVIEVNNLGGLLGLLGIGQSLILNRVTVNNRYVTPESIILVQVLDVHGGTLAGLANLTFSTLVDNRGNGNFKLSVSAHFAGLLPLTLGAADGLRVGYVIVNPAK